MVSFGVTEDGFNKKTFNDIISDLHSNAKRMFGQDVDLTPGSPLKITIDMFAVQFSALWTELGNTYKSAFVKSATDRSLDNLGELVGVERITGTKAIGQVTFFRTTVLPDGSPRIIPAGTVLETATILPKRYKTTASVYFQPTITDEEHVLAESTDTIECTNIIGEIVSVTDSDLTDHTSGCTFSQRTLTLPVTVSSGKTVYVDYKPLSVTAPIKATTIGSDSNVSANTITVLDTPIDFVHYVGNENGIDTGTDTESDSSMRSRIVGASQSVGKATETALEYYLSKVTGVTNVMIESPYNVGAQDVVTANGTNTFYVTNTPVKSITSVSGSVSGSLTVDSFNIDTGEVTLTTATSNGEDLTVNYVYYDLGKIKVYVEGGAVGDANTEDTIVYVIENTRAAGIQSVGYGTGDAEAYGIDSAPFSWFYRPASAKIDVTMTVYFDSASTLSLSSKETVAENIQDAIVDYINALGVQEKLYKTKLIQIAIGKNEDIVDVALTGWSIDSVAQDVNASYIQGGANEIPMAQTITINVESEV